MIKVPLFYIIQNNKIIFDDEEILREFQKQLKLEKEKFLKNK